MKRQVAIIFLMGFFWVKALSGFSLETSISYDYFRGIPDGSWNGNNGALIGVNSDIPLSNEFSLILGGSYGLYNWDGRGNVVGGNSKELEQIGFLTAGVSSSYCSFKGGLVYDALFTHHFGIYNLDPSIDQLRFQAGYSFWSDEVGVWGTVGLTTAHKDALGLPVNFKAIGQVNVFWSHFFENCAQTNVWIGLPYQNSLMFPHGRAGNFIGGFAFRVPLTDYISLDGNGSYMAARSSPGVTQSRNYESNICIGLTCFFGSDGITRKSPYMPVANHANFFVDTNANQ